jgi:hypothetical protein
MSEELLGDKDLDVEGLLKKTDEPGDETREDEVEAHLLEGNLLKENLLDEKL